jgi:hypothetical protein
MHSRTAGIAASPRDSSKTSLKIRTHHANEAGNFLFAPAYSTAVDNRPVISVSEQINDRTGTIRTMGDLVIAGMCQRLNQGRGVERAASKKDFHAATRS